MTTPISAFDRWSTNLRINSCWRSCGIRRTTCSSCSRSWRLSVRFSDAPENLTESRQEREQLLQVVRRMPQERQQLLILKFVDHLSNAEIGVVMHRSEGAVKSLYHRTLLALR